MAPKQKHAKKGKSCGGISVGAKLSHLISIKNCSVSLSVFCIVVSAAVCTILADRSATLALDRTKGAGNDGLTNCWNTAGESTDTLTNLILDQVGKQITEVAQEYTDRPRRIVKEITQWVAAMPVGQTFDYEWQRDSLQPHMWNNLWDEMSKGLTTIGSMTTKGQFVMLFEPPDTVQLPYDKFNLQKQWTTLPVEGVTYNDMTGLYDWGKYHEIQLVVNNGSDYGPVCNGDNVNLNYDDEGRAEECRTWYGAAEPMTGDFRKALQEGEVPRVAGDFPSGLPPGHTYGSDDTNGTNGTSSKVYEPCDLRFVDGEDAPLPVGPFANHTALHGTRYPRNACPSQLAWDPLGKIGGTNYWKKALDMPAPGPNRISSPRTFFTSLWASHAHVVMSTWTKAAGDADPALFQQAPQHAENEILGTVWAGADVRHLSFFLRSLKVGDSDLRVYIAQASDWEMLAEPVQDRPSLSESEAQGRVKGTLIAASHGPVRVPVCTTESICSGEQKGRMRFGMRFLKDVDATDPVIHAIADEAARLGSDDDYAQKRMLIHPPSVGQSVTGITQFAGLQGIVTKVEDTGDVLISFQGRSTKEQVLKQNFGHIRFEQRVQAYETCCRGGLNKTHQLGGAGCLFVDNGYNDAVSNVPCSPEWPTSTSTGSPVYDGYETMARASKHYVEVMVKAEECTDDPEGLLIPIQMTCKMAADFCKDKAGDQPYSGQYCCDFDMSKGPANGATGWYQADGTMATLGRTPWQFPENMTIGDICPQTCRRDPTGTDRCPQEGGVQSRQEGYLARVMRHNDGYGLDWWVVLAVDRKYVYGEIDTQTAYTRGNITDETRKVDEKRSKDLNELVGIVAAIAFVLIVFSMFFAHIIVRPVNKLQNQMRCVAQMELEKVDTREQPSMLHEVKRMQRDFKKMVQCIRKYREFLPMSVLEEVTGRNDDGAAEAEEAARQMDAAPDGSQVSSQQRSASVGRSAQSRTKGTSHSSQSMSMGQSSMSQGSQLAAVSKALVKGVTKKKVTFLALGFKGWHAHFQKISDSAMIEAHTGLLSSMLETFNLNKGVPDAFCGDRVMASFNAVKPVATHKVASCAGALALLDMSDACSKDGLDGLRDEGHRKGKNTAGLPQVSLALASGDAKVGNMGCDGMKKYAHMSIVVTFAYALERHANRLAAGCLLDKAVHCDVENNFTLREAGTVLLLKRGQKPIEVHQLAGRKEASEDEWMYQLEEQNKHQDEFFHWKAVVKAVKEELWDEAAESLQAAVPADAPDTGGPAAARRAGVLAQLQEAVAAKTQVRPADATAWH